MYNVRSAQRVSAVSPCYHEPKHLEDEEKTGKEREERRGRIKNGGENTDLRSGAPLHKSVLGDHENRDHHCSRKRGIGDFVRH